MFGIKRTLADKYFSDYVREKANWCCERCKADHHTERQTLHLSHFWGRKNKSVRFDEENAAALCFSCHRRFTENPPEHAQFFLKKLGLKRYDALCARARIPQRVDETAIALGYKMEIKKLKENRKVFRDYK